MPCGRGRGWRGSIIVAATTLAVWTAVLPAYAGARCAPPNTEFVTGTLVAMFDALSHDDEAQLRKILAPDFYAFDGGRRFDGMALSKRLKAGHASGRLYRWSVTRPDVHIACDTAWIAYVNEGSVGTASAMRPQTWLESATLRYADRRWQIAFLHSTIVTPTLIAITYSRSL